MNQRVRAQPGWILHRRAFRDNSLILDVLTRDYGLISLVARSGRKTRGSSLLQVFQPLLMDFYRRGELGTLGAFEAASKALELNGRRLWCGFYVNELCLRLLAKDQADEIAWQLYGRTLQQLLGEPEATVLRHFEYQLLELTGYSLDSHADSSGRAIEPSARYDWHPDRGLQRNAEGVAGQVLLNLLAQDWSADVSEAKSLLASMLEPLIGRRPLQTAAMLRELSALTATQKSAIAENKQH